MEASLPKVFIGNPGGGQVPDWYGLY